MKEGIIISTTNKIEGCPIKKYIDVISANVVIGTNIFSDIAASFTDFFGGQSTSYENKLGMMFHEVKYSLKQKALKIGANAIVGLRVDFDEISGKDKGMFMVSASGTACLIDRSNLSNLENIDSSKVDIQVLEKEIRRKLIVSEINNNKNIEGEWVDFLVENTQLEIIDSLLQMYVLQNTINDSAYKLVYISKILSAIPKEALCPKVYAKYIERSEAMYKLIHDCYLFDAKHVLSIFDIDIHLAINLLDTRSEVYTQEDLNLMLKIKSKIENLPDVGKIEVIKSGLLGKQQEKFICPNGHKNNIDSEFCENANCLLNIKGLTHEEVKKINCFKECLDVIEGLIKPN